MSNCAVYPFLFDQLKIGYQDDAVTLLMRTSEPACDKGRTALTDLVFRQVNEYLAGQRRTFDFPYVLSRGCGGRCAISPMGRHARMGRWPPPLEIPKRTGLWEWPTAIIPF